MKRGAGKENIKMIDKLMSFYKFIMTEKSVIYFEIHIRRRGEIWSK